KTVRGRARKTRRRISSRSEARSTWVPVLLCSLSFPAVMGLLLAFELHQELVHRVEARIPHLPIALQPVVELAQRGGAQLVDPLLRPGLHLHQPGLLEHPQVLRDLGLVQLQALPDVVDAAGAGAQQLYDAKAVGLGQCGQRLDHVPSMRRREYSCQGIYSGDVSAPRPRAASFAPNRRRAAGGRRSVAYRHIRGGMARACRARNPSRAVGERFPTSRNIQPTARWISGCSSATSRSATWNVGW